MSDMQDTAAVSRKKMYIGAVIVLAVGIALGFGLAVVLGSAGGESQAVAQDDGFAQVRPQIEQQLRQQKEQEMIMDHIEQIREDSQIETFLEDISDDAGSVAALVNDEVILLEEILLREQQQRQGMVEQGQDPDTEEMQEWLSGQRPGMLDNLITTTLLRQRAVEAGVTVSDEDIDNQIDQYVAQFGSREALDEQVQASGMSQDEFRSMIADELLFDEYLENYVAENLSEDDLDFSEEELREAYQQMQQQMQMQQMMQQQQQQPQQ